MRHRCLAGVLLIAIAVALLAQPAVALEPGVHVNPGSPAGFEYAFPLGSARAALSRQSSGSSAISSGPLFGVGIGSRGPRAVKDRHRGRAGGARATAPSRSGRRREDDSAAQARKLATITLDRPLGDRVLPVVGGVLLAGVLAGSLASVLRRRHLGI